MHTKMLLHVHVDRFSSLHVQQRSVYMYSLAGRICTCVAGAIECSRAKPNCCVPTSTTVPVVSSRGNRLIGSICQQNNVVIFAPRWEIIEIVDYSDNLICWRAISYSLWIRIIYAICVIPLHVLHTGNLPTIQWLILHIYITCTCIMYMQCNLSDKPGPRESIKSSMYARIGFVHVV